MRFLWHGKNSSLCDKTYEYFYHIWIYIIKQHKYFTNNLPKQNWSFAENEQAPDLVTKKSKFYWLCKIFLNVIFGRTVLLQNESIYSVRIVYNVNHRYTIGLKFGKKFLTSLTNFVLQVKASIYSTRNISTFILS